MYQAHKRLACLYLAVATDEALVNAKQMTATLIRPLCFGDPSVRPIRT
jgi:hypothetical protein